MTQLDLQTPALYKMGWFDRNCPLTKQCCSINYGIAKNRTWGCWLQSANATCALCPHERFNSALEKIEKNLSVQLCHVFFFCWILSQQYSCNIMSQWVRFDSRVGLSFQNCCWTILAGRWAFTKILIEWCILFLLLSSFLSSLPNLSIVI